jgi:hypothetical protein
MKRSMWKNEPVKIENDFGVKIFEFELKYYF